jgi:ketosteroid isomerase-like protein
LVVFENGHRNDGWKDFRDNHLLPEMKEPAPPSRSEIIRIAATQDMGWGYTKTEMTLTRRTGEKAEATLWSVYVLEKRNGSWKIVLLDWSMRVQPPGRK